jgi:hypothetical protein
MRSFGNLPENAAAGPGINSPLTIPKYESNRPVCLDVEWLLPTLFDASLLTFEPPSRRLFFWSHSAVKVNTILPQPCRGIGAILAVLGGMNR